jgi:hypothetical protein
MSRNSDVPRIYRAIAGQLLTLSEFYEVLKALPKDAMQERASPVL